MKKLIFLCVIISYLLVAPTPGRADDIRVVQLEGIMDRVRIGNDSFEIIVKDSTGDPVSFLMTGGAYEWMTANQKVALEKIKKGCPGGKWPGKTCPVITDRYSRVKVWYIEKPCTFLSYEVLERSASLWITIVACTTDRKKALEVKNSVLLQKFDTGEIINSTGYLKLRSGYQVVVVGAFLTREQALAEVKKAKSLGWKDSYVKKLW